VRDWRRWFEWCVTKAKIENFRWHDLRNTFCVTDGNVGRRYPDSIRDPRAQTNPNDDALFALGAGSFQAAVERIVPAKQDELGSNLRVVRRKSSRILA
jgi:hypothetical protein